MKYTRETEVEFIKRVKAAKAQSECVFRDDNNRDFSLDLIDLYMDLVGSAPVANAAIGEI